MNDVEVRLKALMIAGLDGDSGAYADLLAQLGRYFRGYFSRRIGAGAADLEDLVQDSLLAVHLKRHTYDRAQPFSPWAYAMARYKLLDKFRRDGVRKSVPIEEAGVLYAVDDVEEGAVRRDLDRLLANLPERQRRLMQEVKLAGLTMEEVSRRNNMSVSAAKVAIHRSLKALQERVRQ